MRGQLHLSPSGPSRCSAEPGRCPYESTGHFESLKEAESAFAVRMGAELPEAAISTVVLQLPFGEKEIPAGDLSDPEVRFYFANGLCGDLAMAIHERQGGTPYFAMDSTISESELQEAASNGRLGSMVSHALIESKHNPGSFIDGYGVKTRKEIEDFYGTQLRPVSLSQLQSYGSGARGQRGSHDLSSFAAEVGRLDRADVGYSYYDFGD